MSDFDEAAHYVQHARDAARRLAESGRADGPERIECESYMIMAAETALCELGFVDADEAARR